VRFKHFALREDSGGAGKFRGGCGTTYSFEPWTDCLVSVLGDRVDHVPFGVAGGMSAAPNEVKYRSGNEEFVPPLRSKYEKQPLKAGDLVMNSSPGGGGFGDPLQRALESVELDLNLGYISRQTAERDYGAVIAEQKTVGEQTRYRLDIAASEARRNGAAKNQGAPR
jgi:N-methylhydantoinase B